MQAQSNCSTKQRHVLDAACASHALLLLLGEDIYRRHVKTETSSVCNSHLNQLMTVITIAAQLQYGVGIITFAGSNLVVASQLKADDLRCKLIYRNNLDLQIYRNV